MKKIIAFALVFAIALALLPAHIYAADQDPVFLVETVQAKAGETVTVKIFANNSPGIASVKLLAEYDERKLTLTNIEYNKAWGGMSQAPQTMKSPVTLTWFDGAQDYTQKDSVFATLTFQVADNATGDAAISITYDPEDVYNISETNVAFAVENGKVAIPGTEPPVAGEKPVFSISTVEGKPGETVELTLSARNNPGIASVKFLMEYDSQKLALTKITYNNAWGGMFQQPQTMGSPVTLTWFDGAQDYTQKDSVFATLTFQILGGAIGDSEIIITYDPDDVYNIAENNIHFDVENGVVRVKTATHTHTEEVLPAVAPTCEEEGLTEGKRCSACGEVLIKQVLVPALGHKWVEADCETAKTCSACKKTEGKPAGHKYENGVCTVCGAGKHEGIRGDANGDEKLNYKDALLVLRHSIGLDQLSEAAQALCDVDGKPGLNYRDALMILRASIGLETLN